jgi:hypothetical protein
MQTLTAALPIVHIIDELKAGRVVVTYVQDQAAVGARDRFRGHWVVLAEHARDTQGSGVVPITIFWEDSALRRTAAALCRAPAEHFKSD